jgi:hypothetical protein
MTCQMACVAHVTQKCPIMLLYRALTLPVQYTSLCIGELFSLFRCWPYVFLTSPHGTHIAAYPPCPEYFHMGPMWLCLPRTRTTEGATQSACSQNPRQNMRANITRAASKSQVTALETRVWPNTDPAGFPSARKLAHCCRRKTTGLHDIFSRIKFTRSKSS